MSIANEALASYIRSRLANDSRVCANAIDICCSDGNVCLVGSVDKLDQKKIAISLVTGLIGVRNVREELVVREVLVYRKTADSNWLAA